MNRSSSAESECITSADPVGVGFLAVNATKTVPNGDGLVDEVLLRICRVRADDRQITPEWIARLRQVPRLLDQPPPHQDVRLESAMTLLASALGHLMHFNPTHLPFGYHGPQVQFHGWVEREALERVGKQIACLIWRRKAAAAVADAVQQAVSESVRLGFLEQHQYDAWRPGMPSGSGWRSAVTATPYGVTRALSLIEAFQGGNAIAAKPWAAAKTASNDGPGVADSRMVADQDVEVQAPPRDMGGSQKKQYRQRLTGLREALGLVEADRAAQDDRSIQQVAVRLADELHAWVEAIGDAEADPHPAGGYWTLLGEDLQEMLGPAELATGVFEDDWTPLLTQLQMNGLGELAETLDRLAEEAIPQAQELARDMDAVAYLRNDGPRDAFYELYASDDVETYEACVWQDRQDVARSVMKIVGVLRTLAKGGSGGTIASATMPRRHPRPQPRRGTRTANIEKLEKELEKHLLAARDHAHSLRDRGREPVLLPRPNQKELARRTSLSEPDVSRCFNDRRATVLKILWETADSLEAVMNYKRRR